jgi:hypothetical protein
MSKLGIGKNAFERGLELAQKHPEDFKRVYLQDFMKNTPWTQVDRYIGLLASKDIPFEPVTKRLQIEELNYFPLFALRKGDRHISKAGDFDHVTEPYIEKVLIGGENRKKAYRTAVINGAKVEAIMEKKGVLDGGQTFQNGKELFEQGVKVYCIDNPLYATVTVEGPKITSLVWESVQKDQSIPRIEGKYESDEVVDRRGYFLNGEHVDHKQISRALLEHLDELKEEATPFEELEAEVERKKNSSMLSLITNGKSSSQRV